MYSTVPTGSLVTLGGHLRVVLHSDDATASVSAPIHAVIGELSHPRVASMPSQMCVCNWPTLEDFTKVTKSQTEVVATV